MSHLESPWGFLAGDKPLHHAPASGTAVLGVALLMISCRPGAQARVPRGSSVDSLGDLLTSADFPTPCSQGAALGGLVSYLPASNPALCGCPVLGCSLGSLEALSHLPGPRALTAGLERKFLNWRESAQTPGGTANATSRVPLPWLGDWNLH